MIHEQGVTRELYSRLLGLYPRGFRERLGESMQQTFNDLCEDRKRHPRRSHAIYVLWIFVETAAGPSKNVFPRPRR
jgi:hypothetical protein